MKKVMSWKNKTEKKSYLQKLMSSESQSAISYDKNENHNLGDYIKHSMFGYGFIQKIISKTKIEVFFEDSEKVMLQNWQNS